MGNTVVLKPAEYTSLTALLFGEICREAGLPKGVVNLITGDGRVGEMLVTHQGIDKVAFTGSTAVGRSIGKPSRGRVRNSLLNLEENRLIWFSMTPIWTVRIEGLVDAIWFNQGQVCCAGSRLFVQEGGGGLSQKLKDRMDKLRVGDPLDKSIDLGAIVDPKQLQSITNLVEDGLKEGGTVHAGACELPELGCFYPPLPSSPKSILPVD